MNTLVKNNIVKTLYCIVIMIFTNIGILLEEFKIQKHIITAIVNFFIKSKSVKFYRLRLLY